MTTALVFEPHLIDDVYIEDDVQSLIDTDCIYAGDGDWNNLSRPGSRRSQLLNCLTYKLDGCHADFITDCVTYGIQCPVLISFIACSDMWMIENGHHRFSVAWKYKLPVPIFFNKDFKRSVQVLNRYDFDVRLYSNGAKSLECDSW